jgi:hypothetical protein
LFPKERDVRVTLDNHHARHTWTDAIAGDFHPYVRRCLLAAGLQRSSDG